MLDLERKRYDPPMGTFRIGLVEPEGVDTFIIVPWLKVVIPNHVTAALLCGVYGQAPEISID